MCTTLICSLFYSFPQLQSANPPDRSCLSLSDPSSPSFINWLLAFYFCCVGLFYSTAVLLLFSLTTQWEHDSPVVDHRGHWSHSCLNTWQRKNNKCDLFVKNDRGEMQKRVLLIIRGISCPLIFNFTGILRTFKGRFNHPNHLQSVLETHMATLTTKCKLQRDDSAEKSAMCTV